MFTLLQNNSCVRYVYYFSNNFGFVDIGLKAVYQLQLAVQDNKSFACILVYCGAKGDESLVYIVEGWSGCAVKVHDRQGDRVGPAYGRRRQSKQQEHKQNQENTQIEWTSR